jgi:N,N'-diacetylchitobiose non-reducing end deacetylase
MDHKRVLVFAPHPDDAEFYAGGFLAKMIEEGGEVLVVTVTDGRCGSYHQGPDELAAIRHQEVEQAAALQGFGIKFLGYHDYELSRVPKEILVEQLIRIIREYHPDTVLAGDAFSQDEVHPDHRALAWAASDAINFSQLPNVFPEHLKQGLQPHFITDKYYFTEDPIRMNCFIDITQYVDKKLAGMMAHTSQVEFLVEDVVRQATVAGLDLKQYLGEEAAQNATQTMKAAMLAEAAQFGKAIGVEYAEAYHHIRFHPYVEGLIQSAGKE